MKHIRKLRRCHATGKILYHSADQARDNATIIEKAEYINVYQCEHCKHWHWGHKHKYRRKK